MVFREETETSKNATETETLKKWSRQRPVSRNTTLIHTLISLRADEVSGILGGVNLI